VFPGQLLHVPPAPPPAPPPSHKQPPDDMEVVEYQFIKVQSLFGFCQIFLKLNFCGESMQEFFSGFVVVTEGKLSLLEPE
jgi:hypothetical protein